MTGRAYRLTERAEQDIIEIYLEGLSRFGEQQADRYHQELTSLFELIALNPKMARERLELAPPVRIHPHKAHLIVYLEESDGILIVRVRHGHEDWDQAPV